MSKPNGTGGPRELKHAELSSDLSGGHPRKMERLEDHFHASGHSDHPSAQQKPWQKRPRSPGLQWHLQYDTPESRKTGRILLIDYVKIDHTKEGMRKVATQEINSIEGLRNLYKNPERGGEAVLRVLHVQNAPWATNFLLRKFNISANDDLIGTGQ